MSENSEKIEDDVEFIKALFGHLQLDDLKCIEYEIPNLQDLQSKIITLGEQNLKLLDVLNKMWDKLNARLKKLEKA